MRSPLFRACLWSELPESICGCDSAAEQQGGKMACCKKACALFCSAEGSDSQLAQQLALEPSCSRCVERVVEALPSGWDSVFWAGMSVLQLAG